LYCLIENGLCAPASSNILAKRRQGQRRHFCVLFGEGQADDCNAQQKCKNQMSQANPNAANEKPDDVKNGAKKAAALGTFHKLAPARNKREDRELEALKANRDADYGDAQRDAAYHVLDKNKKAAEENP